VDDAVEIAEKINFWRTAAIPQSADVLGPTGTLAD
jgi:hypothetical protein